MRMGKGCIPFNTPADIIGRLERLYHQQKVFSGNNNFYKKYSRDQLDSH